MKILLALMFLVGCAQTPAEKTYRERKLEQRENCVLKMVREGVSEAQAGLICKDIYQNVRKVKIDR